MTIGVALIIGAAVVIVGLVIAAGLSVRGDSAREYELDSLRLQIELAKQRNDDKSVMEKMFGTAQNGLHDIAAEEEKDEK